jgi:orotidine-5'-phosphate decarboxylase
VRITRPQTPGLIVALDLSAFTGVEMAAITPLLPHVDFAKVGLEAMTAEIQGGTVAMAMRDFCLGHEGGATRVMWDGKFHDIGNTVGKASANVVKYGSSMFTLHASASDAALEAAVEAAGDKSLPLAVTVLTDLDDPQCRTRFMPDNVNSYVGNFARLLVEQFAINAYKRGIRGFVCSAQEARTIRDSLGDDVIIVTPAIRPAWAVSADEQKRVTTPWQAAEAGADYIVVGRPILNPPGVMTPAEAAQRIRRELRGETGTIVDIKA